MAMEACVLALPLLLPGGVLVVTNNTHGRTHDASCPRRGIDGFLDAYVTEVKVLRQGFHVFVQRRREPMLLPDACRSEYYDGEEDLRGGPPFGAHSAPKAFPGALPLETCPRSSVASSAGRSARRAPPRRAPHSRVSKRM